MGEVKDGSAASDRRVGHPGSYAGSGRHRTVRCTGIAVLSLLDGGQGPWFFWTQGSLGSQISANFIGLDVLHGDQSQRMVGFEMPGGGTLLLPEWDTTYGSLDRATGWTQREKHGPADPDGQDSHYLISKKECGFSLYHYYESRPVLVAAPVTTISFISLTNLIGNTQKDLDQCDHKLVRGIPKIGH